MEEPNDTDWAESEGFWILGRLPRSSFWKWALIFAGIQLSTFGLDRLFGTSYSDLGIGPISGLTSIVLLFPWIVITVMRLHDRNITGWMNLLLFIPFINLWPMIECLFIRGTVGPNSYGQDPLS